MKYVVIIILFFLTFGCLRHKQFSNVELKTAHSEHLKDSSVLHVRDSVKINVKVDKDISFEHIHVREWAVDTGGVIFHKETRRFKQYDVTVKSQETSRVRQTDSVNTHSSDVNSTKNNIEQIFAQNRSKSPSGKGRKRSVIVLAVIFIIIILAWRYL